MKCIFSFKLKTMKRVEIVFDYCFCVIKIKKMTSKQAFNHQVQMPGRTDCFKPN